MKALGCAVVAVVIAFGAFFVLTGFLINQTDDQSALTEQVDGTPDQVTERSGAGTSGSYYEISYSYRFGSRVFAHQTKINEDFWERGSPLVICLDPDQPTEHVVRVDPANRCGSDYIRGGSIESSTPTSTQDGG